MIHVYLSGDPVHDRVLVAFYDGCPDPKRLFNVEQYSESDVGVVFGVYKSAVPFSKHRGRVIDEQRKAKRKCIVLETGYVKRGDSQENYYAAGFDGLNGRADFRNQHSPADRWVKLATQLQPWKSEGQDILLAAQVPWDASVENSDHLDWLQRTARKLNDISHRTVWFRPHPKAQLPPLSGCEYSTGPIDWSRFHAVVTYSSNTAVEGLIEGVPVFVDDIGSMALACANRCLDDLENPWKPDRHQWAWDLAYTQWTPAEMAEGLTWKHLFRFR